MIPQNIFRVIITDYGPRALLLALALLCCWLGLNGLTRHEQGSAPPRLRLLAQEGGSSEPPAIPPPTLPITTIPLTLHLPVVLAPMRLYAPLLVVAEPPPVIKPHPPHNATGQSTNVFLTWEPQPTLAAPLRYDLYLEANNLHPTARIAQNLTRGAYDPMTFTSDTQYYWRVIAYDAQGVQQVGPVWTFRVEPHLNPPLLDAMVLVPAGEFQMGCDPAIEICKYDNWHQETPLHRVYLDTYEIDKYEVTNRQYRACVTAGHCPLPRRLRSRTRSDYFNNPQWDYYPVLYVSWWNAQSYCTWAGKRLPTEAEWEKAARGPIDTRRWVWGSDTPTCAHGNQPIECVGDTVPVGSYPLGVSPYGVWDMHGNAFEWVADLYDVYYYEYSPYINPPGPTRSQHNHKLAPDPPDFPYFTLRGGGFMEPMLYARVAHRHFGHHGDTVGHDAPHYRSRRVGFRCARSVAP